MNRSFPGLVITEYWANINEALVELVESVPDDKFNDRLGDGGWSCRQQALHIAGSRHRWMEKSVPDGLSTPDFRLLGRGKADAVEQLRASWNRLERFLSDSDALALNYPSADDDGAWKGLASHPTPAGDGHWIAFCRLQHDILHHDQLASQVGMLRSAQ